jgi:hypothetical protein
MEWTISSTLWTKFLDSQFLSKFKGLWQWHDIKLTCMFNIFHHLIFGRNIIFQKLNLLPSLDKSTKSALLWPSDQASSYPQVSVWCTNHKVKDLDADLSSDLLHWPLLYRCERWSNPEGGISNCIFLLHGLSPRANYTDWATATCRRSDCQLVRIEGVTWSAWRILTAVFSLF